MEAETLATSQGEVLPSDPDPMATTDSSSGEKRKREDGEDADAGDAAEQKKRHPMWKTTLCSFFRRSGGSSCSHGEGCRYAHSEEELRQRPDRSWDPTSEKAKKLLRPADAGSDAEDDEEGFSPATVDGSSLEKCLIGLPSRWTSGDLKKFLDSQGLVYTTAKKKIRMNVGFISFSSVEQIQSALEILDGNSAGGRKIKLADAVRRKPLKRVSCIEKEGQDDETHSDPTDANDKDGDVVGRSIVNAKSLRDVVTPLADVPYPEQLEQKKYSILKMLKRLTQNARKSCSDSVPLPDWISTARERGGLPCSLEGIMESPLITGYRNKCEFTVGFSSEGKKTVGFLPGNFRDGVMAVGEPVNCPNVSKISFEYASIFQDFLQSSTLPIWNRIENSGFWRQLTVREGRHPDKTLEFQIAEVMLIIQVCSLDVDKEIIESEFKRMVRAFVDGAAVCIPPLPLTVVVVQDHQGISNVAPSDCPLFPLPLVCTEDHQEEVPAVVEAKIHDYINDLCFSISPTAFFQVNTPAAEMLYSLAGTWADLGPDTLLFDVCCGTGTIGLTLARRVGMVVGIELNESAVSDARVNAEINGITNCRFVCGKAEAVMGKLLAEYLDIPQKHVAASVVVDQKEKALGPVSIMDCDGEASNNRACPAGNGTGLDPSTASSEHYGGKNSTDIEKRSDSSNGDGPGEPASIGLESEGLAGAEDSPEIMENSETRCEDVLGSSECGGDGRQGMQQKEPNGDLKRQFSNVVAIVDPPRVGLHPTVIRALRAHPRLRRLVYISCNPESLVANAIELCTPTVNGAEKSKGNRGWRKMSSATLARHRTKSMPSSEPFRPVKAMAVDLFPHTLHCELVMLLER